MSLNIDDPTRGTDTAAVGVDHPMGRSTRSTGATDDAVETVEFRLDDVLADHEERADAAPRERRSR